MIHVQTLQAHAKPVQKVPRVLKSKHIYRQVLQSLTVGHRSLSQRQPRGKKTYQKHQYLKSRMDRDVMEQEITSEGRPVESSSSHAERRDTASTNEPSAAGWRLPAVHCYLTSSAASRPSSAGWGVQYAVRHH